MESQHVEGNIGHVKKNPEAKCQDGKVLPEGKTHDFSSASSVSSSSSSFHSSSSSSSLEFDNGEKGPFDDSFAESKRGDLSPFTAHTPEWSMLSASPPPEMLHLSSEISPMKSPPVQTMGQRAGYDPNRIPASIFSTKVTNPSEWSVASNESLFSIHMGNNSFSQDQAILFGKSGELPRLDECNSSEDKSSELSSLPSSLSPVMEVSAHEESDAASCQVSQLENDDSRKSLKVAPGANMENHAVEKTAPTEVVRLASSSTPRLSDESGNSSSSFAFPVLVNDGGKTGSVIGVTEKPEKPQLQEQVPKEDTHKPSRTRWCSWFTCWPRCC
ncbi:hypothetical protein CDL12_12835 [Handroanthus impetiginosus]|uniref:Uncharacterized protein n=1 Tax=Handroanthus impetiginosus TaxID=429701 RepID=A0A2G9HAK6_9LAMI|nr:hypothetical protein CDL12_12835 [Handroanthus impetiginosus]